MFGEDGILANQKRSERARVVSSKALIYSLSREVKIRINWKKKRKKNS